MCIVLIYDIALRLCPSLPVPRWSPAVSLAKQPSHAPQHAVLFRVVWVVFARDLQHRRESRRVCVDTVPYPISNLYCQHLDGCSRHFYPYQQLPLSFPRTCWLIRTMPMSLRSVVKRSKAASMAALSILLSTTRKFFCASGPGVTCCGQDKLSVAVGSQRRGLEKDEEQREMLYVRQCRPAAVPSRSPKPIQLAGRASCHALSSPFLGRWLCRRIAVELTSSPMTARNCRSLKSAVDIVMVFSEW